MSFSHRHPMNFSPSTAAVARPLLNKMSPSTRNVSLSGNNLKI